MKAYHLPESAICVQENYTCHITLGHTLTAKWHTDSGQIRVQYPYSKVKRSNGDGLLQLGHLALADPDDRAAEADKMELAIPVDAQWDEHVYSGKRYVHEASYTLPKPKKHLVLVKADIVDWYEEGVEMAKALNAFANPLALKLQFLVSDWEEREERLTIDEILEKSPGKELIFMPTPKKWRFVEELAKSLNALANTKGGHIVIGVDEKGKLSGVGKDFASEEKLEGAILTAVFQNSPPVPIYSVKWETKDDKRVVIIEVAAKEDKENVQYFFKEKAYKRQENYTMTLADKADEKKKTSEKLPPSLSLEDILKRNGEDKIQFDEAEDVIVLDGRLGLKKLRLGPSLCGLISAGKVGYLIITHADALGNGRFNWWRDAKQQVLTHLEEACSKMAPALDTPDVYLNYEQKHPLIIIRPQPVAVPVAFYQEKGYVWEKLGLKEVSGREALASYVKHFKKKDNRPDMQAVSLHRGRIAWPIAPPPGLSVNHDERMPTLYDVQHQAYSWSIQAFVHEAESSRFRLDLLVPLHFALLRPGENGRLQSPGPVLDGEFIICVENALASGYEAKAKDDKGRDKFLSKLPLRKEVFVHLKLKVELDDLFEVRNRKTHLRFPVNNVLLNSKRLIDIQQACQDSGFTTTVQEELWHDEQAKRVTARLTGINQQKFDDIHLDVDLLCTYKFLKREMQYDGWYDKKDTYAAMLDVRLKLEGTGASIEEKMAKLEMILYRTINQRLSHLQTE